MRVRGRFSAAHVVAPLAFIILAVFAVGGFAFAQRAVDDDERQLLHERAGEVAAVLASSANSLTSSLRLLGDVYAAAPEADNVFADSAGPLVAGGVTSMGVVEVVDGTATVRVAQGTGAAPGERIDGARAELYERAATTGTLISQRIETSPTQVVLVFASGRSDGLVVFADLRVAPSQAIPSSPQSPFGEIDGALYRTPTVDPQNLLLTTNTNTPFEGDVDERTITVGGEQWLLVSAAKGPISSAQSRAVPWIILGGGLAIAAMAAGALWVAIRRRQYALNLVDERTADLHQAMVDLEAARAGADDANRAKSQFLSRMSHELRTPLNAVLGFAQLMQLADLHQSERDSVGHIIKGGNHLLNLINEVLDISRIESGDIAMSPESVLASEVVEETLNLLRPLAAERSIQLSTSPDPACAQYVFADRQRLKQILLNLISNAIKYNRVGGSVSVSYTHLTLPTKRIV